MRWLARAITVSPASSGWRSASSTLGRNSGSSSRNSTPRCASDTSPGRGLEPPPTSAAMLAEWCGARNGRRVASLPPSSSPASECTMETSSISSGDSGGRMEGRRAASIDLPEPGAPIISRLWPPAAATSSTRLALSWPLTSPRSGSGAGVRLDVGLGRAAASAGR